MRLLGGSERKPAGTLALVPTYARPKRYRPADPKADDLETERNDSEAAALKKTTAALCASRPCATTLLAAQRRLGAGPAWPALRAKIQLAQEAHAPSSAIRAATKACDAALEHGVPLARSAPVLSTLLAAGAVGFGRLAYQTLRGIKESRRPAETGRALEVLSQVEVVAFPSVRPFLDAAALHVRGMPTLAGREWVIELKEHMEKAAAYAAHNPRTDIGNPGGELEHRHRNPEDGAKWIWEMLVTKSVEILPTQVPALEEFAQHLRGLREGGLVLHDDNLAKAFWARLSVLGASLNKLYNNADILCEFNNKTYGAVRSGFEASFLCPLAPAAVAITALACPNVPSAADWALVPNPCHGI